MVRRVTAVLLFAAILFVSLPAFATEVLDKIPEPTLSPDANAYDPDHPENLEEDQLYALSAILITQDKGEIIFEKDAYARRYPASTTKILTVLLCLITVEDLYQTVTVTDSALDIPADSSRMSLKSGEEIRLIDVLYGTMLLSGNDGANVIAETVSGSIPAFVQLMNTYATDVIGCRDTHFANAHGYHDDNHYSTAYDLALITREAMKNEIFREIVATTSYSIPRTNLQRARTITTKTEYLLPGSAEKPNKYYFPDATGVKTGSHSKSGYCFIGSASRKGVDLISVVLFTRQRDRWMDTIKLMNYGFSQYVSVTPVDIYNMNPITIETSSYSTSDTGRGRIRLTCRLASGSAADTIIATKAEIERKASHLTDTFFIEYTRDFIAPVAAGEKMGTLTYYPDVGNPVVCDLIASRTVEKRANAPKTLEEILNESYSDPNPFPPFNADFALIVFSPILLIVFLFLLVHFLRRKRHSRRLHSPRPVSRYLK